MQIPRSTENVQSHKPAPAETRRRYWLDTSFESNMAWFDHERRLLLRAPGVDENVHSEYLGDLRERARHLTRDSLTFALVLLERDAAVHADLAGTIIDAVVESQYVAGNPESPLDGLWHYFAEESVTEWPYPDFNWADFNGLTLLALLNRHSLSMGGDRVRRVEESLRRAGRCIVRRHDRGDVPVGYTNIFLKGAAVMIGAGERLECREWVDRGLGRLRAAFREIVEQNGINEYNSGPYAAVSLSVLATLRNIAESSEARHLAQAIEHVFWRHVACRFHRPTRELAAPQSRHYDLSLARVPGPLGVMIEAVTNGQADFAGNLRAAKTPPRRTGDPVLALCFPPDAPPDAVALLEREAPSDWVTERAGEVMLQTWLAPTFCLGSISRQDGWEQRANLVGYWQEPGEHFPGWLRWRWLRDERPCCSGFFASSQLRETVLLAGVLCDYTDHHLHVPADGGHGRFFGPVFEVDPGKSVAIDTWLVHRGDSKRVDVPKDGMVLQVGDVVAWRSPGAWVSFAILDWHSNPAPMGLRICADAEGHGHRVKFALLEADRPEFFRWCDWKEARAAALLRLQQPESTTSWMSWLEDRMREVAAVRCDKDVESVTYCAGDLTLTVPAKVVSKELFMR